MRAVFAEDFIALISLAIAAAGMALHQLTGDVFYDAAGSILIGALMGVAALVLINSNRHYLEGKALSAEFRAEALALLRSQPEIARVTFLYAEFIGPECLLLMAGVEIAGTHTQAELAIVLRDIEQRIKQHPAVGLAFLSLATADEASAV